MPKLNHHNRLQNRREADREFLHVLIATGKALGQRAPEPEKRHAATRVTRRLKLLLL